MSFPSGIYTCFLGGTFVIISITVFPVTANLTTIHPTAPPLRVDTPTSSQAPPYHHPSTGHMSEVASQPNLAALFKAGWFTRMLLTHSIQCMLLCTTSCSLELIWNPCYLLLLFCYDCWVFLTLWLRSVVGVGSFWHLGCVLLWVLGLSDTFVASLGCFPTWVLTYFWRFSGSLGYACCLTHF